jgi:hypothetical protein
LKTVSDDLFRLVKSLTSFEKGYFKKYATKNTPGEKNNYIVLFDAVDKMETYDEELLRKKIKNSPFVKQLPVYKNYLYNLILKSLSSYSTYESIGRKITDLIKNATILTKKALHKDALKHLKRAKLLAVKYENTKALLEILSDERSIIMRVPDKNIYENRVKIYKEQLELLTTLKRHLKLSWLSDQMVMFVDFKGNFRMEQAEKEIKKIMSDSILKNYSGLNDFTSKQYALRIHIFDQFAKDDIQKVHYYLKKEIKHIQDHKFMIPTLVRSYIHALVNYLLFSNLLKDPESVKDALMKISELKRMIKNRIPLDVEIMILSNTCYAEIIIFTNNCEMNKGRSAAKRTELLLSKYSSEIPMALRAVLLFNTARFWFIDGNYEDALKMINTLINEIPTSLKRDVYDISRLLQLIIHFELGNFDLLENTVESAYRFMKERKSVFEIETALFKFLRKILRAQKSEFMEIYEELLFDLERTADKTQSQITLSNFDFIMWIKSRIMNKPMVQLIKENG